MLDIKYIKDNTDAVKTRLAARNNTEYAGMIDSVLDMYAARNEIIKTVEQLKARQNAVSRDIPRIKKEGGDTASLFEEMKSISETIKADDAKIAELDSKIEEILLGIPNIPSENVPAGRDAEDNKVVRIVNEPRKFDFKPRFDESARGNSCFGGKIGVIKNAAIVRLCYF